MHKRQGSVPRLIAVAVAVFFAQFALGDTPVSDPVTGRGAWSQANPDSATDGRDFLLAWIDWRSGRAAVYATRVDAGGTVLDPEGIQVSDAALGDAYSPSVTWAGDSYVVVWQQQSRCGIRRITPDGRIAADAGSLSLNGGCWNPRVAALNGALIVAANGNYGRSGMAIIDGTKFRELDANIGGPFDLACTRSECRLVWDSFGTLKERRFGRDGERLANDRVLATDAMAAAIAATDDRFLVAWRDRTLLGEPSRRIWALELDAQSVAGKPYIAVQTATPALVDVGVSPSGRGFMIAWSQERGAGFDHRHGLRTDAVDPRPEMEIRAVRVGDGPEEQRIVSHANVLRHERPAIASNGLTHLGAWIEERSRKIAAGILNDHRAASRIAVTRTAAMQSEPHILNCGDHLLVTWAEERHADGRSSILARRFHLSGEALDAGPIVIADSTESQHRPVGAFDGNSYLVAWHAGSRTHARRIDRDFSPAAAVLSFAEDQIGAAPAAVGTGRGFAVLHGEGRELVLTRIGAGSSPDRTPISGWHDGQYALGWTGAELMAVWSGYDHRVQAARVSWGGVRLGSDVLVGFGNNSVYSLSMACDASECITAWGELREGVKTATIANGRSFLLYEPNPEAPYYRAQSTDRYRPSVVRAAGEYKVISYGPDGALYQRSVRDGALSAESTVNELSVDGEDFALAATADGLLTIYSRSVPGPGYGGSRRLFLHRHAQ